MLERWSGGAVERNERRKVLMQKLAIWILLVTIADVAYARPDVRTMTCAQAKALVLKSGSVVMTTGKYTYERYVAGRAYCERPYVIRRAWIATKDTNECLVGFRCVVRPLRLRD
jgi:hypothetical protein